MEAPEEKPQETKAPEVAQEDVAALETLTSATFAQGLVKLFQAGSSSDDSRPAPVTSEAIEDKAKRAQLHGEVRRIFNGRVETTTGHDGTIVASFVPPRKGKKSRSRRGRGGAGGADEEPVGEYLHFTMYKDNRDTMDAVNQIARLMRIKPQVIGYAGTKDRRASTTQRCSVRYTRKRALAGLNGKLWGISTGDYAYRDAPIHLGELGGNEFVITLKNCKSVGDGVATSKTPQEQLAQMEANVGPALQHMATHGWINYFGHQRFGTHEIGTHEIGKLILGDQYEAAIDALLTYDADKAAKAQAGEIPEEPSKRDEFLRHQACMLFQTGEDLKKAAQIIPRRFAAESNILQHLTRSGQGSRRDFAGAITHITRGLRSMYLHAYQSHVWNHAASHRWELYGDKVVEGDLVIAEGEDVQEKPVDRDQDGDEIINPGESGEDEQVRARALSAEEAASGRYSIYEVVLPSPGYDVIYPSNEIGRFYEEFMGREANGALDPHKMRRLRREFSLPGRYRKLMGRFLAEPSAQFKLYADDTEQMHPTDMDKITAASTDGVNGDAKRKRGTEETDGEGAHKKAKAGVGAAAGEEEAADKAAPSSSEAGTEPTQEPSKIAVIAKFQLASSAYATVVLRELMGDTAEEEVS